MALGNLLLQSLQAHLVHDFSGVEPFLGKDDDLVDLNRAAGFSHCNHQVAAGALQQQLAQGRGGWRRLFIAAFGILGLRGIA